MVYNLRKKNMIIGILLVHIAYRSGLLRGQFTPELRFIDICFLCGPLIVIIKNKTKCS